MFVYSIFERFVSISTAKVSVHDSTATKPIIPPHLREKPRWLGI